MYRPIPHCDLFAFSVARASYSVSIIIFCDVGRAEASRRVCRRSVPPNRRASLRDGSIGTWFQQGHPGQELQVGIDSALSRCGIIGIRRQPAEGHSPLTDIVP
jgi:hypothetical protein